MPLWHSFRISIPEGSSQLRLVRTDITHSHPRRQAARLAAFFGSKTGRSKRNILLFVPWICYNKITSCASARRGPEQLDAAGAVRGPRQLFHRVGQADPVGAPVLKILIGGGQAGVQKQNPPDRGRKTDHRQLPLQRFIPQAAGPVDGQRCRLAEMLPLVLEQDGSRAAVQADIPRREPDGIQRPRSGREGHCKWQYKGFP